ncbi:linoleate 13S-lipoxygenase 2-1, chloroplastic-like [Silene latifolia]|uniref:linoleate 13S-lipoxygenase 2-1, chloroplastic-like n=1 Tax=Silene latifolia TaxID=37657 RepID=UPI003D786357
MNIFSHPNVSAVVTEMLTVSGTVKNVGIGQVTDVVSDIVSGIPLNVLPVGTLHLELVSTQLEQKPVEAKAKLNVLIPKGLNEVKYEAKFHVNDNFGKLGAVLLKNEHSKELYVKTIVIMGLPEGTVEVTCNSWIASSHDNREKRVFFTNQSYITSNTPPGLISLREKELQNMRGNGQGKRKSFDRIYDYDVYNDLGEPDSKPAHPRPVLGGDQLPYPRRCRTGRPPCKSDPLSETRTLSSFYIPRDEVFADLKTVTFGTSVLNNVLHTVVPTLEDAVIDTSLGHFNFRQINDLFHRGIEMSNIQDLKSLLTVMPNLINPTERILRFPTPDMLQRDQFSWFRDEEFARETLAGPNPSSIKLVTEWPLMSKLDSEIYGSPESKITTELVEQEIKGVMSFDEALQQKKLFVLDYHDVLLPFVNKVREIQGTTLYGSRTLFFLTPKGTLRPLAIELTRPPMANGKPQWKQVYTPGYDATSTWLWRLAKAHVLAHDSGHHQIVSHWLRTHCCIEPFVIATNRQLSAVHPIYRLLNPYFRYTMEINSLARGSLVNAGGFIETTFSLEKYSMEFGSLVYDKEWRFDHQALPTDLISRGIAIEDESSPHGLKLAIEDYPYANDGLLLWDAVKQWITDYVKHYYQNEEEVQSDTELQQWWAEIREKGHGDKKDEKWWPVLTTSHVLIEILTTMIWVASGHHAAVNFGQYLYGGYFPNRPTTARIKMPTEDPTEEEWKYFVKNPCNVLLNTLPSRAQGIKVMTILNVLSSHSPDEEYIGEQLEPSWAEDPTTKESFEKFHLNLKKLDTTIDARNADEKLNNRTGAGVIPYELLKPFSTPGTTGMGVPNSVSI